MDCHQYLQPPCMLSSAGLGNTIITGFVQTLLTAYCEIASYYPWPPDYGEKYTKQEMETFDFIIVGGGTAGAVIAGRLSENPNYRVLLIEAGFDPPIESTAPGLSGGMIGTKFAWSYDTMPNGKSCIGNPGGTCLWVRGKTLGGSSAINLMYSVRGNRRDFDRWQAMGNPSWGWDSVTPYFKKTEDYRGPNPFPYHGVDGPLVISRTITFPSIRDLLFEAGKQSGLGVVDDFRDGQFVGFGPVDLILKNFVRNTPATAFLLDPKPNLFIIKNAIVKKINFDEGRRARSVDFVYTSKDNKSYELKAQSSKEIIISAGVIESPKLLQLSGIGPSKLLQAQGIRVLSDLSVGENLQDHVLVYLLFRLNAEEDPNITDITFNYFIHHNESFISQDIVNVALFMDVDNKTGEYPNMQSHFQWLAKGSSSSLVFGATPVLSNALNETLMTSGVLVMSILAIQPKSRGSVRIKSSDFQDKPIIDPNYLSDDADVEKFIKAIHTLIELENTPAFKKHNVIHIEIPIPGCEHAEKNSDEYWECYIRYNCYTISHPTSTVKMGPNNDPDAIVDPTLKVKSVSGLRVADGSIMPIITSGNPMLATIMIGEKAADFIKEEWRSQ